MFQHPAISFDRTYEGLKQARVDAVGDADITFDRTYEGLKLIHSGMLIWTPPFDRTYEGLKLAKVRRKAFTVSGF